MHSSNRLGSSRFPLLAHTRSRTPPFLILSLIEPCIEHSFHTAQILSSALFLSIFLEHVYHYIPYPHSSRPSVSHSPCKCFHLGYGTHSHTHTLLDHRGPHRICFLVLVSWQPIVSIPIADFVCQFMTPRPCSCPPTSHLLFCRSCVCMYVCM
ncbi:hypothetical protein B0H34DRAFT_702209 [Crassisporium funariophilum]|nr:hypothetical protein B0H34DRAFT_702209 [Crassisporium funariophilum]